jgi:Helix-turn-helix domain
LSSPALKPPDASINASKNDRNRPFPAAVPRRVLPGTGRYGNFRGHRAHLVGMDENTAPPLPRILTQTDVGKLLQISPRTLEDWRLTKTGPPYRKLGKHVRYELDAVMRWFESLDTHA